MKAHPGAPIVDLAVVGAGAAGMAAAVAATELGLSCVVLDEQPAPGGQVYRNVERAAAGPAAQALGRGYARGAALARAFRGCAADYRPGATVWHIETGAHHTLWYLRDDRVAAVTARRVMLAGGAIERAVPVPGWTLPGVMTVGALQIVLKTAAMTPETPAVLIGCGPLILLTAIQHVAAGGRIGAVLLTGTPRAARAALRHLPGFLRSGAWRTGLRLLRDFHALGLPVVRGVAAVEILGQTRVETVRYRTDRGRRGEIATDLVGLHEGVIPNSNLARAIGCVHVWDDVQQAFRPEVDDWANSSVPGVQIVGDGAGIAGADACPPAGRIAALEAARALGRIGAGERDARAAAPRRDLARILHGRPFVDTLFAPRLAVGPLADDVVVCRCEEVTAGAVRGAVASGAQGPNQVKAFLRCGMGPCQGRFCGPAVTRIIAEARGVSQAEIGYFRLRPPVKPIPLRAFAAAGEAEP